MTSEPPRTVFFLSDFGTEDEFAGVVHAVIAARAPGTTVIDLTHHIPPFDVRAGSHTLLRAVPHLGPGVVLAVVDPGVGTERRGIGLEVALPRGGTMSFVGPDNGLLVAAAEAAGEAPVTRLVELAREAAPSERGRHLRRPRRVRAGGGGPLHRRGAREAGRADRPGVARAPRRRRRRGGPAARRPRLPAHRGHLGRPLREPATGGDDGRRPRRRDPVDRLRRAGGPDRVGPCDPDGLPHSLVPDGVQLRCVDAFGELEQGEFGLLVDANGHLAVVAGEASAAHWLNVAAGELLVLAW